jgi:hypothetical protein
LMWSTIFTILVIIVVSVETFHLSKALKISGPNS